MYKALYRKWRPVTFDDVVSQPHITTTLKNQLTNDKTAHAYLFTGTRGTGKTTCARIFAKAINCKNPAQGEPCLECEVCKGADEGILSDIIEIDAASNNGVDDIRDIREKAMHTPELCKYRIYIIDEVHMLSTNAFNALLKIMEEPPPYIKFILATTEVHKIPATILSRCQRFDFHRIKTEDIVTRIKFISQKENINIDDEAAALIAKVADGGMRDALSLLDQCVAYSNDVTLESVSFASGIAGRDYLFDLLDCIIKENASDAITIIDKLYSMSKDMQRLCEELLSQMRNLMLIKTVPKNTDLLACLPDEIEKLKEMSKEISLDTILKKLTIIQECSEKLTRSISKRTELEMCLIRLCTPSSNTTASCVNTSNADINQLLNKIIALEQSIANENKPANQAVKASVKAAQSKVMQTAGQSEPAVDISKIKSDMLKTLDCWPEILADFNTINPAVSGSLKNSQAFYYENLLLIIVENEFFIQLFRIKDNAQSLGDVIKAHTGKTFTIRAKCGNKEQKSDDTAVNKLIDKAKRSDIQVEIKKF